MIPDRRLHPLFAVRDLARHAALAAALCALPAQATVY
jgi:hypothetical protein